MRSRWSSWRSRSLMVASWVGLGMTHACDNDRAVVITTNGESVEEMGSLRLALVTPEARAYRLRRAVFDVAPRSGEPAVALDSEDAPDATELVAELAQGFYDIELRAGWSLEELTDEGTGARVRAALVSPNPTSFSVRNDRTTEVVYTFTTDAGVVRFGSGALSVRVGFADPGSLARCDIVNQVGCAEGQSCLLADDAGRTFCASVGPLPVGASCESEQCVFGAQCLELDRSRPGESTCTRLCNPLFPPFGCACLSLSFDEEVGVCGPLPPGACDLLTQSGCAEQQACQLLDGATFGTCGAPGALPNRALCVGELCEAGLDCFGDDPELGFSGQCLAFCDLLAPSCSGCFDVGTGTLGRCFF